MQPNIRHLHEQVLSDNWYTLKKYTFEQQRAAGKSRAVKPTIAATARSFCFTTARVKAWC